MRLPAFIEKNEETLEIAGALGLMAGVYFLVGIYHQKQVAAGKATPAPSLGSTSLKLSASSQTALAQMAANAQASKASPASVISRSSVTALQSPLFSRAALLGSAAPPSPAAAPPPATAAPAFVGPQNMGTGMLLCQPGASYGIAIALSFPISLAATDSAIRKYAANRGFTNISVYHSPPPGWPGGSGDRYIVGSFGGSAPTSENTNGSGVRATAIWRLA